MPFPAREVRGGKFYALLLTFGARSASPSPPERRKNYIFSDMGLLAGVLSNLANRAVLALFLLKLETIINSCFLRKFRKSSKNIAWSVGGHLSEL